jgi:hypothetical protein
VLKLKPLNYIILQAKMSIEQFIKPAIQADYENTILNVVMQLSLAALSDRKNNNSTVPAELRDPVMPSTPPAAKKSTKKKDDTSTPAPAPATAPTTKKPVQKKPRKFACYAVCFPKEFCVVEPINFGTGAAALLAVEHTIIDAMIQCNAKPGFNIDSIQESNIYVRRIVAFVSDLQYIRGITNMPHLGAACRDAIARLQEYYTLKALPIDVKSASNAIIAVLSVIAFNISAACLLQNPIKRYTLKRNDVLLFVNSIEFATINADAFIRVLRINTDAFAQAIADSKAAKKKASDLRKIQAAIKAGKPIEAAAAPAAESEEESEESDDEETGSDYDATTDDEAEIAKEIATKAKVTVTKVTPPPLPAATEPKVRKPRTKAT